MNTATMSPRAHRMEKASEESAERLQRDFRRRVEAEEDLHRGLELSPVQTAWRAVYRSLIDSRRIYEADCPLPYVGIGYYCEGPDGTPLSFNDNLVQPLETVRAVLVHLVDTQYWNAVRNRFPWRINVIDMPLTADGGEIQANPLAEGIELRVRQRDWLMPPMRDHYRFDCMMYDQAAESKWLRTPYRGLFSVERNTIHLSLCIDGVPVCRILTEDAHNLIVETDQYPVSGTHLNKGDFLGEFVGNCWFGALKVKTNRDGNPLEADIDRIGGDVISASRESRLLEITTKIVSTMIDAADTGAVEGPQDLPVLLPEGAGLDFGPANYSFDPDGYFICKPVFSDNWRETAFEHGGIVYLARPTGKQLIDYRLLEPELV